MENQDQQLKDILSAEKQEFLAVMSHELRTPMTGAKGYLSMILDGDAGEISPDVREYVAQAYVANDRLIRLVERMMKTVALQEGKVHLNIQKIDLVKNLEILTNDFQIPAKEKKLTLIYEKPPQPIFVLADPDRLREVLMNLISNAIKFTGQGSINIKNRDINSWAVTDIIDTGIGVKKEDQGKLFEIFTKANLSLAGQEKGTGLGLYLARNLAEKQGGKVWLEESEPGKGSTFSAAFPKAA
ncbi:hypothetical protein A2V71_03915 [Candidatus Berkelbacteria bacterium RBG_13_40_8]|uniref:histidine kinase n=1 Tax=Candidatus Berkelbacteria bacterium RBG_13_40_8 TaxID=1797467 RepID=A0A1F5DLP6_9BACT|nr:MAG: hypothetical protein A2V71_03915 [Candidatus Berkelbacteria bacterium RBG_13_40_8]